MILNKHWNGVKRIIYSQLYVYRVYFVNNMFKRVMRNSVTSLIGPRCEYNYMELVAVLSMGTGDINEF